MQQINIVTEFINCICCRNVMGLEKILSPQIMIAFNDVEIIEKSPIQCMLNQFHGYVSNAEKYEIKAEKYSIFRFVDDCGHVDAMFRLLMYQGINISENWFRLSTCLRGLEIQCIHMLRYEILTKRQVLNTREGMVILPENQIYYLESDNNHVCWHCKDGEYRERATMNERAKALSDRFVNVRKSHWVNMDFVINICRSEMIVFPDVIIAVPRARLVDVKKKLAAWNEQDNIV